MKFIDIANERPIPLGRIGENAVTTVRFAKRALFPFLGAATYVLVHQRNGDADPYVVNTEEDDDYLYWLVNNADVGKVGSGVAQLTATNEDAIAKSYVFNTEVGNSLGETGEAPDPSSSWVNEVVYAARQAGLSATAAQLSADAAATSAEEAEEALASIRETGPIFIRMSYNRNAGTVTADVSTAQMLEYTQQIYTRQIYAVDDAYANVDHHAFELPYVDGGQYTSSGGSGYEFIFGGDHFDHSMNSGEYLIFHLRGAVGDTSLSGWASYTSISPGLPPYGTAGQVLTKVSSVPFDVAWVTPSGGGGSGTLEPATTSTLGGIIVGSDLLVTAEGVLSVDKATAVEQDNTKPITAAAVYTEVGNINALLATI